MIEQFHFLRPAWLLAIPLAALVAWWRVRALGRGGVWQRWVDPALQPYVVETRGAGGSRDSVVVALALALAATALAGPTWERAPVPVFRTDSALVVALDLSRSMNAEDLAPSRLALARFKIADLLAARTTGQSALVVYAAHAFAVTPLTDDTDTLLAHLRGLDTSIMPSQGSEPAAALALAGELLDQAGAVGGHVLLVTDGVDGAAAERALAAAGGGRFTLSVLGVGTTEGAPIPDAAGGFAKAADGSMVMSRLDRDALRRLATAGGGLYLDLGPDDSEIARLAARLETVDSERSERLEELAANQWREFGPWLLLALLPLAACAFRRGFIAVLAVAVLPLATTPARADWWRTDDQAGAAAFAAERYDEAAARFASPAWQSSAHYRAGEYEQAAAALADATDADALYNRGNALARLGRYDEAIAAYDAALEQRPGDDDARHNKELLEELLRQQQESQGGGDDQQSEDQESGDDQQRGDSQDAGGQRGEQNDQEQGEGDAAGGDEQDSADQAASDAASDSAAERRQAEQEQADQQPQDSERGDEAAMSAEALSESDAERAQATEQWLRQIPDDPAGLLRRKFQYQYKQRYGKQAYEGDRW